MKTIRFSTIAYVIKQGMKNIARNKMFSIASIITMTACIFMFSLFYSILTNFQNIVHNVESNVTITVFLDQDLEQSSLDSIETSIKENELVESCEYVSGDQAWAEYKEVYFEGKEELAEGFENDNPLANSSHFVVGMHNIESQGDLVVAIEEIDGVRQINQSQQVATVFTDMNKLLIALSAAIIIILVTITVFLISNTIHTAITVRKNEIAIMKIIGSTDTFVRYPFIIEGVTIGFIGSIIPLFIFYHLYNGIMGYVHTKFISIGDIVSLVPEGTIFTVLVPVGILFGVGIGFLGSYVTLHKHLKV